MGLCLFILYGLLGHTSCYYSEGDILALPAYNDQELNCPSNGDKFLTSYSTLHIPWGTKGRAWYTVPPEIEIKNSTIPGVGLGTISKTFISSHTWLAEYEGEIISLDDRPYISKYAWGTKRNNETTHYIDAGHVDTSNWLRWINCARTQSEQNVKALYCKGKVFYYALKNIAPEQELLVYYGKKYAAKLGIDVLNFK